MAFPLVRAARLVGVAAARPRAAFAAVQTRAATGIKIMEDKGKAAEAHYWAQEDEKLLQKMIANNPELDPAFQGISNVLENETSTADMIKVIFMKHGIPPIQKGLIADLVDLVEKK